MILTEVFISYDFIWYIGNANNLCLIWIMVGLILLTVYTSCHFEQQILNSQIKYLTGNLAFGLILCVCIIELANNKTADSEVHLYSQSLKH